MTMLFEIVRRYPPDAAILPWGSCLVVTHFPYQKSTNKRWRMLINSAIEAAILMIDYDFVWWLTLINLRATMTPSLYYLALNTYENLPWPNVMESKRVRYKDKSVCMHIDLDSMHSYLPMSFYISKPLTVLPTKFVTLFVLAATCAISNLNLISEGLQKALITNN